MLGFQVHPTIELPRTLKIQKDKKSETKSLNKNKWSQFAYIILGILLDGKWDICVELKPTFHSKQTQKNTLREVTVFNGCRGVPNTFPTHNLVPKSISDSNHFHMSKQDKIC